MHTTNSFFALEQKGVSVNHPLVSKYGRCIKVSDGLESILWLFPESSLMIKKGIYNKKVLQEAVWIKNLPEEIRRYFPRIISINSSDNSYIMEALPYQTVSSLLNENKITARRAFEYWRSGHKVFLSVRDKYEEYVPSGWEKTFLNKAQTRLRLLENESALFSDLSNHRHLIINDQTYLNAPLALERIRILMKKDISLSLRPNFLTLSHLDLQFSNILAGDDCILLDPTGGRSGDPLYDLMKAIHSTENEYIKQEFLFVQEKTGISSLREFELKISQEYTRDNIQKNLIRIFETWVINTKDDCFRGVFTQDWPLRFWYEYATTMIGGTYLLFRSDIHNKLKKSLTRYLISTIYLNIFVSLYISHLISVGIDIDRQVYCDFIDFPFPLKPNSFSSVIFSLKLVG